MFEQIKNPFLKHANRINFKKTLDSSYALFKIRPMIKEILPDIYPHLKIIGIKNDILKIEAEHPALTQRIQEKKSEILSNYQKLGMQPDIKSLQIIITY